jgi:NADPH-dependent glutamate synthase beta subunit-like oxidoreductase
MVLSVKETPNSAVPKGVAIIGTSVAALQAALTLAQMGIEVKVITDATTLGWNGPADNVTDNSHMELRFLYPLLVQAASHPLITLYTSAEVEAIEGERDTFKIQIAQRPRYIHEDLCTGCGRCQAECPVSIISLLRGQKTTHSAIHMPRLGAKAIPSAFVIDKNAIAPCNVGCPLDINVQGFVSLLGKGKTDEALNLINEAAPLAGILGRVCRNPCEDKCNRAEVDSPVSIRALHRYVADNATEGIKYNLKAPAGSREGKIAIVGSGPAGLTAAWELKRRGYSPAVFESHGVIGGMLATGIPRFRLPREVREGEMEAIKNLGIDIRAGITVGRDVTFAYLKERGYRAFFLAIGAQRNNKLNIPGEELEGVVDCMSLLLTLNLKVDTFLGLNVVVIGDGNSAIDSARAANRKNEGSVKVLSWTIPEEITAAEEEVEEALQERVSIEYCAVPVEILGSGGKVTGIRCQRTRLTDEIMANGRHRPEPIPGTDFVIDADHVVVSAGQSPNASQLDIEGLTTDSNTGVIQVNPLTLETSIPAVFAGGDCITGPNNVVEAMAAGLRAAESIDRYLQGRDLETGRTLEPPETAEIDVETTEVFPYKRAPMPVIHLRRRMNSFEETTVGLSAEAAQRESQRCLNCALCSQCMECNRVCELGAVFHDDDIRHFEVGAQIMLKCPSTGFETQAPADSGRQETTTDGVYLVPPSNNGDLSDQIMRAMALAMKTTVELRPKAIEETKVQDFSELHTNLDRPNHILEETRIETKRIGVILCRCGSSINSIIDFKTVTKKLLRTPGVNAIREVAQACTESGAEEISNQVAELQLDRVVIAACRCCNSEQVCYSCTDRRRMCQQYLDQYLVLPLDTIVEFVNIREQCAWVHRDTPKSATRKAVQIISAGVERVRVAPSTTIDKKSILPTAVIIGEGLVSATTARVLASQGYQVDLVTKQRAKQGQREYNEAALFTIEQLQDEGITIRPWPDTLELQGSPGNYAVVLEYGSQADHVPAGAVIVDIGELSKRSSPLNLSSSSGLLGRTIARIGNSSCFPGESADIIRGITIGEKSGLFLVLPGGAKSPEDQSAHGLAIAARVSTYLERASISPRATAAIIDKKLCRGCGDCADICPYIEMKENGNGTVYAYLNNILCFGCGACVARCPAGAITQPLESDKQLVYTLQSMLHRGEVLSGV